MQPKEQSNKPGGDVAHEKHPSMPPAAAPEQPVPPEEDPDYLPDEDDPFEITPYNEPAPGEGP